MLDGLVGRGSVFCKMLNAKAPVTRRIARLRRGSTRPIAAADCPRAGPWFPPFIGNDKGMTLAKRWSGTPHLGVSYLRESKDLAVII